MMKAIHIASFLASPNYTSLHPSNVPRPVPKDNELLVRVTHISPQQVDLLYSTGKHQNNNAKRGHIHPPFILGLDFAGIVISTPTPTATNNNRNEDDRNVTCVFKPGDRITASHLGAFAEYITIPVSEAQPIPPNLSNVDAAALVGGVVSYAAVVNVADVKAGEWVLVTGVPGGLGVIACAVAKARGARVIALARTEARALALRGVLGIEAVVASEGDWVSEVRKITGGKGVSAVIDNVGVVEESLRCCTFGARIVLVGFAGRKGVMETVAMNKILLKGAKVIGFRFGEATRQGLLDLKEIWKGYLEMVSSGVVRQLIDPRVYRGLEQLPNALQDLADGNLDGKAVVGINEEENKAKL